MTLIDFQSLYHEQFQQIWKAIESAKKIAVLGTATPDGDSLGAQLALTEAIESNLNKKVDCIVLREIPQTLQFLPGIERTINKDTVDGYDLICAVDCGEKARVPFYEDIIAKKIPLVLFDHHQPKEKFGTFSVTDARISCTGQLLYYFFKANNLPITNTMATNILTCVSYDTGNFQHANTTAEVLEVAAVVAPKSMPLAKISRSIYRTKSVPVLQLWGRTLKRARLNPKTKMVMSTVTVKDLKETGLTLDKNNEEIKAVVDLINTTKGSRFTLLLREEEGGGIRASLRSEEDRNVDVAKIAEMFGGGGHKLSSGFGVKGQLKKAGQSWIVE